jgi:hypothetical protein
LFAEPPAGSPSEVIDEASPPKSTDEVPVCEFSKLTTKPIDGVTGFGPPLGAELLGEGDALAAGLLGPAVALGEGEAAIAESFKTVQETLGLSPVNQTQRFVPVPPS